MFTKTYEPKYPKAALSLQKDRDELMAFFDFPAQHWQSIRTSNPIESAFATIRHRTKRSKGCLNRDGMLHIPPCDIPSECTAGQRMFKLGQCAEENWPSYAALIISPKSSLASNSKTELKPQEQARSLLDTKTSNTKL